MKLAMDKKFGKSWQCVIGEGFGFSITYELKNMLYMFFNGNIAVLVFKGAQVFNNEQEEHQEDEEQILSISEESL